MSVRSFKILYPSGFLLAANNKFEIRFSKFKMTNMVDIKLYLKNVLISMKSISEFLGLLNINLKSELKKKWLTQYDGQK